MGKYVAQRLIAAAFAFIIIVALIFFVLFSMPGNIVSDPTIKETVRKAIEEKYHLNEPLPVQFAYFIRNYMNLDFGTSLFVRPGVAVFDVFKERIGVTIQLNLFSALFTLPVGMFFGITMALKKDSIYDIIASSLVVFFISVPGFVMAAALQYFLAYKLGWFPIVLAPEVKLNWTKFHSMILPIFALSFGSIASIARLLRAELAEALTSEYMLLAKAKGLTFRQRVVRHALRNACVPLASTFLYLFIGVLSSSLVIENIFGVPGLSKVLVSSINAKDHQLTLGITYFYVLIGLLMSIAADLSYGIVDPRIRMGGRKDE
ncbi:MAG: ABC transporter permease [Tissierellia bacterium]|nr:ABC transporter permease [Tissierellia bacterium]